MFELKRSSADQVSAWAMTAMVGLVPLLLGFLGLSILGEMPGAGVFLIILAAPLAAMAWLCVREANARSFTNIRLDAQTLNLRLPAQRGYVAYAQLEESIPRAAIAALETRAEAFSAAGTTVLQYAWSLVLRDGRRIVLGADRRFTEPFYQQAGEAIAAALQLPVGNRGLVDGNPGFLMFSGQSVPPWDAPSVAPAALQKRVKDEAFSWRVVALISGAALGIAALARAFGG